MGPSSIIGSQNNGGPKHGEWKIFGKFFFIVHSSKNSWNEINPFHEKLFSEW